MRRVHRGLVILVVILPCIRHVGVALAVAVALAVSVMDCGGNRLLSALALYWLWLCVGSGSVLALALCWLWLCVGAGSSTSSLPTSGGLPAVRITTSFTPRPRCRLAALCLRFALPRLLPYVLAAVLRRSACGSRYHVFYPTSSLPSCGGLPAVRVTTSFTPRPRCRLAAVCLRFALPRLLPHVLAAVLRRSACGSRYHVFYPTSSLPSCGGLPAVRVTTSFTLRPRCRLAAVCLRFASFSLDLPPRSALVASLARPVTSSWQGSSSCPLINCLIPSLDKFPVAEFSLPRTCQSSGSTGLTEFCPL